MKKWWTFGIQKAAFSFNLVLTFFQVYFTWPLEPKESSTITSFLPVTNFRCKLDLTYLKAKSFIQSKQNIFIYKKVLLFGFIVAVASTEVFSIRGHSNSKWHFVGLFLTPPPSTPPHPLHPPWLDLFHFPKHKLFLSYKVLQTGIYCQKRSWHFGWPQCYWRDNTPTKVNNFFDFPEYSIDLCPV